MEKLSVSKEKILSAIKLKGPSLPVQIAREIQFSPLFASAFLSELKGEGKIKMSNMRVGSSPLYFLPGQEAMLEKSVAYLNQREKEAFQKLKAEQVLEDSAQDPVMRVALRAIKDFAVPVKIRIDGESKLFWKHFNLDDEEVAKLGGKSGKKGALPPSPKIKQEVKKEVKQEVRMSEKQELLLEEEKRPLAEKKKAKVKESEFAIGVKDILTAKDIEILHVVTEKKKEFEAKVRIDTMFGKQTYYLVAKDKKSVTDNDLVLAEKKGRNEKLPAVFMSPGELNKKGRQHLEQWGNLVKFEKLRF